MSERVTTARVRELRDEAACGFARVELANATLDVLDDLLEAREELRLTTPAVDAVRGVIAALDLAPDATHTEVVAAVEERAGMLAHAVQSWKARASGMEAAEREVDALRAIVEGRTVPPTDAEMREHMDGGGAWLVTIPARRQVRLHPETRYVDSPREASLLWWTEGARWVAVRDGRPCAWPAPREPAAADVARDAPGVG